jgi:hypothetical protein
MRPEGITKEQLIKWHESYLNRDSDEGITEFGEERWYTGEWLGEELTKINCPSDLIRRISFACGQRQAACMEPWPPAIKALEEYKQGRWEEPGMDLAKKILREQFGDNPNPMEILAWLSNKGFDLKKALNATLPEPPPNMRN